MLKIKKDRRKNVSVNNSDDVKDCASAATSTSKGDLETDKFLQSNTEYNGWVPNITKIDSKPANDFDKIEKLDNCYYTVHAGSQISR